jgi:hypothetical protein
MVLETCRPKETKMVLQSEANSSGLYAALTFHHARLETSGRHVLSALHLEGPRAAKASFAKFRCELDAHLEAEEAWVLPGFARVDPESSQAICAGHAQIRKVSDAVARSLEAPPADESAMHELLELLDLHCRREEHELYRWAETGIGESESRAVIQKIEMSELCGQ